MFRYMDNNLKKKTNKQNKQRNMKWHEFCRSNVKIGKNT